MARIRILRRLHPNPRGILTALALVIVLFLGIYAFSPAAYAGNNGQLIRVCGLGIGLAYGKIVGASADGTMKTWVGPSDGFLSGAFTTYGSRWNGEINVYESPQWSPQQFLYVDTYVIPRNYVGDIYTIGC